ncbi:MAG: acyltransferase [Terracidiphilus sp.]
MQHNQSIERVQRYQPCLAGIRGYGFLLVFCGHYFIARQLGHPDTIRLKALTALSSIALFAVPSFFVLSGYLIGGILYHTRHREGYFKIFYTRRILRVFPVFYITLLTIGCFALYRGIHLNSRIYLLNFLYVQNLVPDFAHHRMGGSIGTIHFWSLAVEEQFYLLWPLVVWLFPERRKLIAIASGLIAASCALRLAAPLFSMTPSDIRVFTPTQVDAILAGVLLGLLHEGPVYNRIKPFAKWVVASGCATVILLAVWKGELWAWTYWGDEILIPISHLTAVGIVMMVMDEGSFVNRLCSQRWVCGLGGLSYSMYVFHLTFAAYFMGTVMPELARHMRLSFAILLSGGLAFATTLALGLLSYLLIERPVMRMKHHLRYGSVIRTDLKLRVGEPVLSETSASV